MELFRNNINIHDIKPLTSSSYVVMSGTDLKINSPVIKVKDDIKNKKLPDYKYREVLDNIVDNVIDFELDSEAKLTVNAIASSISDELEKSFNGLKENCMDNTIEKRVIELFGGKDDVLEIRIVNESNEKEIWLIVKDRFSKSADIYNSQYYDVINEFKEYFIFRVLESTDLEQLRSISTSALWRKDDYNA